ncbi:MAG: DinB family protein [Flavobacterium sp.]|nr:MAG: DinB family protein [Flavobacterium sp.]
MSLIEMLLKEMNQEAVTTRKFLSIIPENKFDWQPHPKSMSMRSLATHIAELPSWVSLALTTDELDFAAAPYEPTRIDSVADLLTLFEKSLNDGRSQLVPENELKLQQPWTLRNGDTIFSTTSKLETIRHAFNQITHHRAQLGVYLRLLDVPVPSSYGPSADDPGF